jgi:hypothetical protein
MDDGKLKLTMTDRIAIGRYINVIPCTIEIRLSIDRFNDIFLPTANDIKKAGAVIEKGKLIEITNDFSTEFNKSDIPEAIRTGVNDFISSKEGNKNITPNYIDTVIKPLKKLVQ